MHVLVLSDLHFEFQPDGGRNFCKLLTENIERSGLQYDVAVIAGDLCDFPILEGSINLLASSLKEVVYVIGNHECYHGSIDEALDTARNACSRHQNAHFLEDSVLELNDRRFLGSTLWFKYPPKNRDSEWAMNDFDFIKGMRAFVGEKNRNSVSFLRENVKPGDIVVTHHLPGEFAVHRKWKGNSLNKFFLTDMEKVIIKQKPAAWIHGHSHESINTYFHSTKIVRNPFGYLQTRRGPDINKDFISAFIVHV